MERIEKEMKIIADSGMEEILILTGESRGQSDVTYIGEACRAYRKYFRMVGLEIYPVNTDESLITSAAQELCDSISRNL